MAEKCSEQVVVRLEPGLRRAIEEAAAQDRRPLSSLVRCVLSDWLKQHEQVRSAA
jgi:hypothetical protein